MIVNFLKYLSSFFPVQFLRIVASSLKAFKLRIYFKINPLNEMNSRVQENFFSYYRIKNILAWLV